MRQTGQSWWARLDECITKYWEVRTVKYPNLIPWILCLNIFVLDKHSRYQKLTENISFVISQRHTFRGPGLGPRAKNISCKRGKRNTHTRLDWFPLLRLPVWFQSSWLYALHCSCTSSWLQAPFLNCHDCFTQVLWVWSDGNLLVPTENQASEVQQDERNSRSFEHDGSPPGLSLRANSSVVSAAFSGDQTQRFCQTCVAIPAQNENRPVSFLWRQRRQEAFGKLLGRGLNTEIRRPKDTSNLTAAHRRASHPFSCSQIIIKQQNRVGS